MNNTFQEDLKRGIDIELQVLNIIQKKYPSATDWDFARCESVCGQKICQIF